MVKPALEYLGHSYPRHGIEIQDMHFSSDFRTYNPGGFKATCDLIFEKVVELELQVGCNGQPLS